MTEPISKKTGSFYRMERKRKLDEERKVMRSVKPIQSFFKATTTDLNDESSNERKHVSSDINETETNSNQSDVLQQTIEFKSVHETNNVQERQASPIENIIEDEDNEEQPLEEQPLEEQPFDPIDDDPSKWHLHDSSFVQNFLKYRVQQCVNELDFSNSKREYTNQNRYCNVSYFFKKRINGEVIQRTWIHYSVSLGKMFCIYCKLFSEKQSGTFICNGFDDWRHYTKIEEHEHTNTHRSAAFLFAQRLQDVSNLKNAFEKKILDERRYWIEILKRVVNVIKFLSARGLPLRGDGEHIGSTANGNFLGIMELLAEHDQILEQHIHRYGNKGKGSVSYLSSTIVDEIITILALEVRKIILKAILICKYFALIIDSTPDVAHIDQLTICIRYVNDCGIAIERFLIFLANTGHKGKEMEAAVVEYLKASGLIIRDCRGQSYDNAKNMSGIYKGLQTMIKQICPLAEYVPCSPHSLNLTLQHAVEGNSEVARFFLFLQNIYVFFSDSTKRWSTLLSHLKSDLIEKQKQNPQERMLVPKKLSGTRWSARYDACRALKSGYRSFAAALQEIFDNPVEKKIAQIEAESLYKNLFKLETAILLEFWTTVLQKANVTSKSLQNPRIDIETSTSLYKSLHTYIGNLRSEESFNIFVDNAKALIQNCSGWEEHNPELTYNCYEKRVPKRNTRDDIGKGSETILSDSEKCRISIIYSSLDSMTSELATQIEAYETVLMPFSFMFKLNDITDTQIREGCTKLKNIYVNDLDEEFYSECIHFKFFMKDIIIAMEKERKNVNVKHDAEKNPEEPTGDKSKLISIPSRMLQYIRSHQLEPTFPNLEVALRIFECIAVANATGERSFSGMKRIKAPLRSVLGQEKMNDLALLFINNDLIAKVDTDTVIRKFLESKNRKCF